MADKSLLLEVVTPDRQVVSTEVDIVVLPGVEGQFGVLGKPHPLPLGSG